MDSWIFIYLWVIIHYWCSWMPKLSQICPRSVLLTRPHHSSSLPLFSGIKDIPGSSGVSPFAMLPADVFPQEASPSGGWHIWKAGYSGCGCWHWGASTSRTAQWLDGGKGRRREGGGEKYETRHTCTRTSLQRLHMHHMFLPEHRVNSSPHFPRSPLLLWQQGTWLPLSSTYWLICSVLE